MPLHIPKTSDRDPANFATRNIAGRQRMFGIWRGERAGKLYEHYQQAITAAETIETNRQALANDPNLTEEGQLAALQGDALPFLKARKAFAATATKRREELKTKANATLATTLKDYDINSPAHGRLIETYRSLDSQERARLFASDEFVRANRELALAVYAEPAIVTKADESQRSFLQSHLLTDEQRAKLTEIDSEAHDLTTTLRAFDTARETIGELTGMTEQHMNALEDTLKNEPPPDDDKPRNLANGGRIKLETTDET